MAQFTMELKDVLENIFGTTLDPDDYNLGYTDTTWKGVDYKHLPTVTDWNQVGLGYYPIFDEGYRPILNGKIVYEFYRREIGMETIDLWLMRLNNKMHQIMPYYNKLYNTELIPYSALDTMNISSTRSDTIHESQNATANNTATNTTNALARAVSSETPNTMLSGDEDYATNATDSNSQTTANNTGDSTTTGTTDTDNNGTSLVTGYQAAASDLITKFRATLLNIDMMVIRDLDEMFMGILNTSDNYTNKRIGWLY